MRRTLILGANGMLGFALAHWLADLGRPTIGTVRTARWTSRGTSPEQLICDVDALDPASVKAAIMRSKADIVVNCLAVRSAETPAQCLRMFRVNGAFPRKLACYCAAHAIPLIQFGTDAMFDGVRGGYDENSPISPQGGYARSKAWGELRGTGALTLRTSLIGRSPDCKGTLLDWLLCHRGGPVKGYSRAVFSGLTVTEVARFLHERVLDRDPIPHGIAHLAADAIDKHALLARLAQSWGHDPASVVEDRSVIHDRSLRTLRAHDFDNYRTPSWPRMIEEMRLFYLRKNLG